MESLSFPTFPPPWPSPQGGRGSKIARLEGMKMNYNDTVMDHFTNPHQRGGVPNADGVGQVGNPACGDIMKISLRVKDDRIEEVKFKTFGLRRGDRQLVHDDRDGQGKSVGDAAALKNTDIAEALGGLPPIKMHCSSLAARRPSRGDRRLQEKEGGPGGLGRGGRRILRVRFGGVHELSKKTPRALFHVIPAEAGIQLSWTFLDARLRGHDGNVKRSDFLSVLFGSCRGSSSAPSVARPGPIWPSARERRA